jgi:hypothetical protein
VPAFETLLAERARAQAALRAPLREAA